MRSSEISPEPTPDLQLEVAHLLLIDVVGYSRLLVNEQIELLQELNRIVRGTECFGAAHASGRLTLVPTGDGMALVFFRSPEEPVRCSLEIGRALQKHPHIRVRMGIHSGAVNQVKDVNDALNIVGTGINVAQRVMDCGDAGHILLSKHVADDLSQYRHWHPFLHDLGECEVKHGLRLHIFNLFIDGVGNPAVPEKLRPGRSWRQIAGSAVRPVSVQRWPKSAFIITLLLSVIVLAVSWSIFLRRGGRMMARTSSESNSNTSIPVKSIAVLPFSNLSDAKQNEYFTLGVQDEILNDLAKVADLKVISRTSVMDYRAGATRNLQELARELRVTHIVEGTVQRTGDRVRVSAQLIDARTDTHLWAEHYDRDVADVFAIESEVAKEIVSQLKAKLSPEEKAAIELPYTTDLAAHELYIRANELMARSVFVSQQNALLQAASLLNEAVTRDPSFFLAYCGLASVHDQIYLAGMDHSHSRLALAEAAIEAARRIQPDSPQMHLTLADHFYCADLDYVRANQELALARHALPNEPRVFELDGYLKRRQGRWDESTRSLNQALELAPRNFYILQNLAISYHYLRNFREEAATEDRALQLLPKDNGARLQRAAVEFEWHANTKPLHSEIQAILSEDPRAAPEIADSWIFLALGEHEYDVAKLAMAAMPADGSHNAGFAFPRSWSEAIVARAAGDSKKAHAAFSAARIEVEKTTHSEPNYGGPLSVLAMIDAGLGRREEAIREGRRAVELLPVTKDAINGSLAIEHLAIVYAWVGEKDEACKQLAIAAKLPGDVNYGQLLLDPQWDSLRGDQHFEQIVASLAPKS